MATKLRDGSTVKDPRLGRLVEFDERSRRFAVRSMLPPGLVPRSQTWRCDAYLDQGQEPECVGFAWTHDDAAAPIRRTVTQGMARDWYRYAQRNDEWAGENYGGSSTLGGAKAGVALGRFKEYRWCFGIDDLVLTVGHLGPVVVGTVWTNDMFHPNERGFVAPTGAEAGGHEWLVRGVNVRGCYFLGHNSWGRSWGQRGTFRISFSAMDYLLRQDGDACWPVRRVL